MVKVNFKVELLDKGRTSVKTKMFLNKHTKSKSNNKERIIHSILALEAIEAI